MVSMANCSKKKTLSAAQDPIDGIPQPHPPLKPWLLALQETPVMIGLWDGLTKLGFTNLKMTCNPDSWSKSDSMTQYEDI